MYNNSEQRINPKVLSVANSSHYNENYKEMQKIVHRQMPDPRELLQQIKTSRAKAMMQKP